MSSTSLLALFARYRPLSRTAGKCKLTVILFIMTSAAGAIDPTLPAKAAESPSIRTDRHGDPLPDGAIARLGTVRWRHGFSTRGLAYSPDGKMLAAVGDGRAITLWDAATGKEIHAFPLLDSISDQLAFSPDGKLLATSGESVVRLWDVATGKELRQISSNRERFAFSPDGKFVVIATHQGGAGALHFWDLRSGKESHRIECGPGFINALAYSPDGKRIATSSHNDKEGTIHLWDAATGKEQHQLSGHKQGVWRLIFSPNGKRLASSSGDKTIRLWDPTTGRQVGIFSEKQGSYDNMPIAFSPQGTLLASGRVGCIHVWDAMAGKEKRRWQTGAKAMLTIAFSPDGKTIVSGAGWETSIHLWDVATGREKNSSEEHSGAVDLLRFSADGAKLISIGRDRRMLSWDLPAQKPACRFSWAGKRISMLDLSPEGDTLAVRHWSWKELHLWDTRASKPGRLLGKHQKQITAVAFSPNGRLVASAEADWGIHIWDVHEGKEIRQIKGRLGPTWRGILCFSPDSKALAGGILLPPDKIALRLWQVDSGEATVTFPYLETPIGPLAFSPDGKVLGAGAVRESNLVPDESCIYLWNTATGKEQSRHLGHRESVEAIAFSPDGKLVASGAGDSGKKDNSVHVWEAATGRLIHRFEGQHSCVMSVAFAPDGLTVASGGGDSTILLWDITGRRLEGRWNFKPLTPRQLGACWTTLAKKDAAKAYDAMWMFVAAPKQAVPFLRHHLSPVPRPDVKIVARLIADLDSDDFAMREKAKEELSKFDGAVAPAMRQALTSKPSLEMRRRLEQLLDPGRDWTAEHLCHHRAMQALEHIGTRQAREVLQTLAEGAPAAHRTEEAKAALRRMAH